MRGGHFALAQQRRHGAATVCLYALRTHVCGVCREPLRFTRVGTSDSSLNLRPDDRSLLACQNEDDGNVDTNVDNLCWIIGEAFHRVTNWEKTSSSRHHPRPPLPPKRCSNRCLIKTPCHFPSQTWMTLRRLPTVPKSSTRSACHVRVAARKPSQPRRRVAAGNVDCGRAERQETLPEGALLHLPLNGEEEPKQVIL